MPKELPNHKQVLDDAHDVNEMIARRLRDYLMTERGFSEHFAWHPLVINTHHSYYDITTSLSSGEGILKDEDVQALHEMLADEAELAELMELVGGWEIGEIEVFGPSSDQYLEFDITWSSDRYD